MYSSDAINWTEIAAPSPDNSWQTVTYGNGYFVATSSTTNSSNRTLMYSSDGINWTAIHSEGGSWQGLAYGNGKYVAVSNNGLNLE